MKRFTFALDGVLHFKRRRQWLAEMQQQQAAAALEAARAEAATVRERLDRLCVRLHDKVGTAQDPATWMAAYHQSIQLQHALEAAHKVVDRAARELERVA